MKRPALLCLPLGLLLLVCATGAAQTSQPSTLGRSPELLVSGNPQALWVARVQQRSTRLFRRTTTNLFDLGRSFRGRIVRMTTLGRDLLAFDEEGNAYRYMESGYEPIPERILPDSAIPDDLIGTDDEAFALIPEAVAARLRDEAVRSDGPPSIIRYDLRDWLIESACPEATRDAAEVRIAAAQDRLIAIWRTERGGILTAHRLRSPDAKWSTPHELPLERPAERMFVTSANRLVTVIALPAREQEPEAFRILDSLEQKDGEAWRRGAIKWSELPEDVQAPTYTAATGFNQDVAVLTASERGTLIRFAAIDSELVQDTVDVQAVLAEPAAHDMAERMFVTVTLLLLLVVLIGLFAFRRESMVQPVLVPDGYGLAPVSSRIMGFLIDFVPFSAAAAIMLDIPFSTAMQTLFAWGFSPEQKDMVRDGNLLLWWGLSVGGYATYSLVMELATGRTVGKALTGTRVLSETGSAPSSMQILTRNVMRGLELLPHFWVFGLLVVLSRNQQRLGDVFARTYVARRTPLLVILDDTDEEDDSSSA